VDIKQNSVKGSSLTEWFKCYYCTCTTVLFGLYDAVQFKPRFQTVDKICCQTNVQAGWIRL